MNMKGTAANNHGCVISRPPGSHALASRHDLELLAAAISFAARFYLHDECPNSFLPKDLIRVNSGPHCESVEKQSPHAGVHVVGAARTVTT
ncbi:hypothetical protein E4U53_003015, partial [Claviceps sorghi]